MVKELTVLYWKIRTLIQNASELPRYCASKNRTPGSNNIEKYRRLLLQTALDPISEIGRA
jgi:hypothetical protein